MAPMVAVLFCCSQGDAGGPVASGTWPMYRADASGDGLPAEAALNLTQATRLALTGVARAQQDQHRRGEDWRRGSDPRHRR